MHRRAFLATLAAAPLLSLARTSRAQGLPEEPFVYPGFGGNSAPPSGPAVDTVPHTRSSSATRLKSIVRDGRGTTLWLGLDHAPFADGGYRDDTVIVFVPSHYRFHDDEGVATLTHLHGHSTTAERAMVGHQLREQVADSKQNALLVVPQLAVMTPDSSCGKLEAPGGLQRLLEEVIPTVAHEAHSTLGETAFPHNARLGTACVSAHSGGYHGAACCLRGGGIDVRETYLFDALTPRSRHSVTGSSPATASLCTGATSSSATSPKAGRRRRTTICSERSSSAPEPCAKRSSKRASSRATTYRTRRRSSCVRDCGTRR